MSRPITPINNTAPGLSMSNSQKLATGGSRPSSYIATEAAGQYASAPQGTSILSQSADAEHTGAVHDSTTDLQRSTSHVSLSTTAIPSRGGTLKKRASVKRSGSLNRSGSKKGSYAGSVRSMRLGEKEKYEPSEEHNSAFYCPVPITGSPTELLADRFHAWRKVLKDLIVYFRDLQKAYDTRSKTLHSASNVINNLSTPPNFMSTGGLADATSILRDFHKLSLNESNKSRELENEVITQLTGLRSDLQQKIKEIKSLSGDFKNSVAKEQDVTRKAVRALQDSLGSVDHDASATAGKGDPYLVKMGVDRQLEKQIEEENYLHRAYLNLEASGRELESIVVGEIQKAYNVLANIMKREADNAYETVEKLREGPVGMPKDREWDNFVTTNDHMVDPRVPVRQLEQITYSGKDHPAALDVRSGMLERKSKYLKNYTPGWYVLSPTHLHEFKSADRINYQSPVMSLYLPDQKLGTHSDPGSNSHKFMLKGRQTGSMHRGHSWIFRAETHDTMLAWYSDIKELTERRGEARNEFVRRTHARTLSSGSMKAPSINSAGSGMEDDEADQVAFSGEKSIRGLSTSGDATGDPTGGYAVDDSRSEAGWRPQRPTPGGRFPSDLNVQRGLQAPLSPSSGDSIDENDRDVIAAAGALPGSGEPFLAGSSAEPHANFVPATKHLANEQAETAASTTEDTAGISSYTAGDHRRVAPTSTGAVPVETASTYGEWMAPIAAGAGGAGLGVAGARAYDQHKQATDHTDNQQTAIPAAGQSSAAIAMPTTTQNNAPVLPRADSEASEDTTGPHTASNSAHNAATLPASTGVGVVHPAPSQTLAAAGINVSPTRTNPSPLTTDNVLDSIDATGLKRPELPHSAKSVQTISDLHVPGEYPRGSVTEL